MLNLYLSSPPQRRGQGWWFALPRFSAGAIKKRRRLLGSVSVRSTDDALHRSYPALQATKGGSSRGNFPLDPVLLPFAGAKGRPRRRGVLARPCIRPTPPLGAYKFGPKILLLLSFIEKYPPPTGEMKLRHGFCRQSLRLISFATSLYTREAFGWCDAEGEKKLCCSLCWQPLSQPYGCQLPLHRGAFWLMRCRNLG